MSLDLKLAEATHDLDVEANDLALVVGVDEVTQRLRVRLKLFRGEWYLDENAGVPYYVNILTHSPKMSLIEAVFRKEILSSSEIEAITYWYMNYNRVTRQFTLDFKASSSEGEIEVSEVFPP